MAREVETKLIDDLDGGPAAESVNFALDGRSYEIDLSAKNATKLRNALAPYVEAGSRVRPEPRTRGARQASASTRNPENQEIRAWALRKGMDVASRGRISEEVIEAYHSRSRRGRAA
jgi:hypothetical protein